MPPIVEPSRASAQPRLDRSGSKVSDFGLSDRSAPQRKRTVAVIGAGPSGLCTTKELLEEGHSVTCFECADDLGGIFNYRSSEKVACVWESCRLTSSILITSFSDFFPDWSKTPPVEHRHFTHREYIEYLRQYAENFFLMPHVRFACRVTELRPLDDGGWAVTAKATHEEIPRTFHFDAVAVCTGVHQIPHIPSLPGLAAFHGQILHSAHYRTPKSIQGKSAVFVGAGESGAEIAAEASHHLDRCHVSLRRGVVVIPRLLNGLPNDYTTTRLIYSLPELLMRRSDPLAQLAKRRLKRLLFPLAFLRAALIGLGRLAVFLRRSRHPRSKRSEVSAIGGSAVATKRKMEKKVEELIIVLREQAGANQFETFATKTESFLRASAEGRCEIHPAVDRVHENGVTFSDGQMIDVDSIVFCTGYEPSTVPFLVGAEIDLRRLYLNCFTSKYREKLAFIGFLRPPLGAIPPMAEMQARWFSRLLSGSCELPDKHGIDGDIARRQQKRSIYFHKVFARLPHLVDYTSYMDTLAEKIGCKPRIREMLLRPKLVYKLYAAPFSALQYRLRGPHARPEMAEHILLGSPSHAKIEHLFDLISSRLAGWLGVKLCSPRLSLFGDLSSHNYNIE
jgi:hypothetical protein